MSELFQQTLESVSIGILAFDGAGRLIYINPAAEEILHGSSRAFAGKHYRTVFRGSPGAVRILRKALEDNSAVTGYDVELRLPRRAQAAGDPVPPSLPVIIGASPMPGPGGEPNGAVLSIKPAEILSMVGQEEMAAVSAEEVQTLAYGIAHEIKNPLGGILGAAQWMMRGEASEVERREGTRLILREAERINSWRRCSRWGGLPRRPAPSRSFRSLGRPRNSYARTCAPRRRRSVSSSPPTRAFPTFPGTRTPCSRRS